MNLKNKLYSNVFWRNVLATFGERSGYSKAPGEFVPYFQYRIGPYQPDFFLYFSKEPWALRYKNEIFNKLQEYTGYDIIRYLEFHYGAYSDQAGFLRFLQYEIIERIKVQPENARLNSALSWVKEKQVDLNKEQQKAIREEIKEGVREIIDNQPSATPQEVETQIRELSEKLGKRLDAMVDEAEQVIRALTGKLVTGEIELTNRNHEEKLIQLLILLQQVKAPHSVAIAEQLFSNFTATDISAILYLHFTAFKDYKINTLQRKVGDQTKRIKHEQAQIKKLEEALKDFFYH